ncbi:restriction endonuclease subunit S [Acinetobacter haemolyticus]|uniref:restriction endonuclease subunit S n=1 Tax=Acinetobacter haemolyticus TaxID=29430 RepID=UPI000F73FA09|nr:restriction endonuclease subunit S [Acinetobacter haemolyticus]RSN78223.1 restriction endonuclease subunit S [Acinetobacter haemolyticus]
MTDVKKLITEHLDIWLTAETEKKSGRGRSSGSSNLIYGVQKLRELIFDCAIRGRLTQQNENDNADKIILEVSQSIEYKNNYQVVDYDSPFQNLPSNWCLSNLLSISYINPRNQVKDEDVDASFIPMTLIPQIYSGKHLSEKKKWKDIKKGFTHFKSNDIGIAKITPCFENSKACVFEGLENDIGAGTTELHIVRPIKYLESKYVLIFFKSPTFLSFGEQYMTGTAGQKRLPKEFVSFFPFPLPPFEEQKRIVVKVDELMQLCDQLEQQQNLSSEAHDQLVDTLLNVLTNSSDVEEFQQNWKRISENFDLLFTTEYSIEQLKQTILQLAIMGKLVKQDPTDEPASELLKQIAEEKAKLVKEGKIKKSKPLSEIDLDKAPFEIPDSWAWARFSELGEFARGKSKHRPRNDPALFNPPIYPLVQTGEVARAGNIILEYHSKYSEVGLAQSRMWSKGTLCITIAANIADSAILGFDACFPDSVVGFTPVEPLHSARYLLFFMKTARQQLLEYAPATAQKNINLEILESVYIPIPPLNEQEKIIQTVDVFLNICNVLKDKIKHVNSIKCELSDALVSNALKDSNSISKPKVADNLIHFEKPIEIVKQSKQKSTDQIDLFTDESIDDDLKLLSLAAEITFQLHTEPTFGHLKLQKLIYLCQKLKHMDLAADFKQHAAGPYDPVMACYLDKEFKDREWFSYDPKRDLKYKPLSRCNDHRSAFNKYFAKDVSEIYDLIGLFRTSKSDHIEIVATLFACWLRLLEKKLSVTEEQLLKDFYAWSEEKNRFGKAEVLNGYKWMKQNSIVPL